MKRYDFDQPIERHHTDCVKYDSLPAMYGCDDLLPMWVADMDFRSPDFVIDAMRRRLEHPVLGYGMPSDGYHEAVTQWLARRYGICADRSELHFIPGIVAGIAYALLCFTQPGDRVLVTTPVYPPFLNLPHDSGRTLVYSPLRIVDGRFAIDFDDLERRAEGCKMLILSNPHNPAGTVWGEEVLRRVADICERHNLLVVSDEIHADLTLPGHRHVSYSSVGEAARRHSITFMAPSKTFNIAGLGSSVCYIGEKQLRERFFGWLDALGVAGGNIFAFTAAEAAFKEGEEWLAQVLDYLDGNVRTLGEFLRAELPRVKAVLPEASYLAWLDFSAYGIPHKELCDRFINRARVVMNDGTTFGLPAHATADAGAALPYSCCFRLNLGCPRATLADALRSIADAL